MEVERERTRPMAKRIPKRAKEKPEKKGFVLREDCFRVLNEKNVANPKLEPKLGKAELLHMYKNMCLSRQFDERGMKLQRQGRIGFYVPAFGQEAIPTGSAAALTPEDWIFPSYREPGLFLYRGASLEKMLCNLYGNSGDICLGRQMPNHYSFHKKKLFSVSSPISTQVIQAVGAAMAFKVRKEKHVAMTFFGDGGTSENDFHTALTFAGAYKAPTVFICTNNQYAISVPVHKQTGAKRIADKAIGYGMEGVAVDGNDVLAVYKTAKEAVDKARKGGGPTLIECLTLRMGPHSSSDDPTRYRDPDQFDAWVKRDPILKLKEHLGRKKWWNDSLDEKLQAELKAEVLTAVDAAEKHPEPGIETLFDDVFEERTPQLQRQYEELKAEKELRGKFVNTSEAFPL